MKTQTTAIQSELVRVRNLKRALEVEVEMLRSDTECGKLHIRVNQAFQFRQELAKAIVDSSSSGSLSWNCSYYVDSIDGIIYKKEAAAAWNPWSGSISWRIVPIESLLAGNYDFSSEIEDWSSDDTWEGCDIGFSDIVKAWLTNEGEELEDSEIPEWTKTYKNDIVSFGFDSELGHYLEAVEAAAKQRAINFALESIPDEIIIKF